MELHQDLLKTWAVRMRKNGDDCWTLCEARSELGAMNKTERSWGTGWRAMEAKITPVFHQELNAETFEEIAQLNEQRRLNLIKANSKIVVTPLGEFASIGEAAEHYGTKHKLMELMKNNPEEYYFKV